MLGKFKELNNHQICESHSSAQMSLQLWPPHLLESVVSRGTIMVSQCLRPFTNLCPTTEDLVDRTEGLSTSLSLIDIKTTTDWISAGPQAFSLQPLDLDLGPLLRDLISPSILVPA